MLAFPMRPIGRGLVQIQQKMRVWGEKELANIILRVSLQAIGELSCLPVLDTVLYRVLKRFTWASELVRQLVRPLCTSCLLSRLCSVVPREG